MDPPKVPKTYPSEFSFLCFAGIYYDSTVLLFLLWEEGV